MNASQLAVTLDVAGEFATAAEVPELPEDRVMLAEAATAAGAQILALARRCNGKPDPLGLCPRCGKAIEALHDPFDGCLTVITRPALHARRFARRVRRRTLFWVQVQRRRGGA